MRKLFTMVLFTVLMLAGVAYAAQAPIFFADFECNCWSGWSWNPTVSSTGRDSIVNDGSNYGGASSTRSAQTTYPAGLIDGGGSGWSNFGKAQLPDHFMIEYDFKLSPNFYFPHGQKMLRVMPDMNSGQRANDTTMNAQLNFGSTLTFEVFSNSSTFGQKEYTIFAGISRPSVNTWHRLGYRFKKNTFNGSTPNENGETEIFLDGKSVGSRNNVRLTAVAGTWFRDHWGGPGNFTNTTVGTPTPAEQWIRVDNFKITSLSGGVTPPPPPPPDPPPPPGVLLTRLR